MKTQIAKKLLELESEDRIFYGLVPDNVELDDWNYFVFGQQKIRKSGTSGNDLNGYWYVVIVRENYIDDETLGSVIDKLSEISGLRLANNDFEYVYTQKGGTGIIVEMLVLQFTKMKKGVITCQ